MQLLKMVTEKVTGRARKMKTARKHAMYVSGNMEWILVPRQVRAVLYVP